MDVSWIHTDGRARTNNYIIPNVNQCKGCHKSGEVMMPIGPKARHLNRDFAYREGTENQLAHWSRLGALAGAPLPTGRRGWPPGTTRRAARSTPAPAPGWRSTAPTATIPAGPARSSGLDLLASQHNPAAFGVNKPPVAAGIGSGGREYDIVPGRPDESILAYRIASTHPGVMMPELGKRLVHEEGVALVRQWIAAMTALSRSPPAASADQSSACLAFRRPRPHLSGRPALRPRAPGRR